MVEFEADDALAAAAARFDSEPAVDQILIGSPDKDLAQCVSGARVVSWDRRREIVLDEEGVLHKFGVHPESIPDWLALVGDSADGYPGLPGWGAKSASAVLGKFGHLERIPEDSGDWGLPPTRAARLSETLRSRWDEALLYRRLATLREDVPLAESLAELEWRGARRELRDLCQEWGETSLPDRIVRWDERS
jgi:5'-3' exonuclease